MHLSLHLSLTPSQEVQSGPEATLYPQCPPSLPPFNTSRALAHTKGEGVSVLCITGHRDVNKSIKHLDVLIYISLKGDLSSTTKVI